MRTEMPCQSCDGVLVPANVECTKWRCTHEPKSMVRGEFDHGPGCGYTHTITPDPTRELCWWCDSILTEGECFECATMAHVLQGDGDRRYSKAKGDPLPPLIGNLTIEEEDDEDERPPAIRAFFGVGEIHVDLFAGGGGASVGAARATGRSPDVAINHSPAAIAMHKANHPKTRHWIEDVYKVDPRTASGGSPVALLWMSPTCTHFSKAKGDALDASSIKIRGLAWSALPWIVHTRPRVIILENVEEFEKWGPLHRTHSSGCSDELAAANRETWEADETPMPQRRKLLGFGPSGCLLACHRHKPIKAREGETFRAFVKKIRSKGYAVDWTILKACDYGAPTTRKRLYMRMFADGKSRPWPKPTHGTAGSGLLPFRTAAEIIDWSIPCPSIFERAEPLADKTMARIARGIQKFVIDSARPFIVPVSYGDKGGTDVRVNSIDHPMPTVCGTRGGHAVITPVLVPATHGDSAGQPDARIHQVDEPLRTLTTRGAQFSIVTPIMIKAKTHGGGGNEPMSAEEPLRTITASKRGEFAVATATIVHMANGEGEGATKRRGLGAHDVEEPLKTICAGGGTFAIATPILVRSDMHQSNSACAYSPDDPLRTITSGGGHAVAVPYLIHRSNGERAEVIKEDGTIIPGQEPRTYDIQAPHPTVVAEGLKTALCVAFLNKHNGGHESSSGGQAVDRPVDALVGANNKAVTLAHVVRYNGEKREGEVRGGQLELPLTTIDTANRFALATSHLVKMRGTSESHINSSSFGVDEPLPTISAGSRQTSGGAGGHIAEVRAFLMRYNGQSIGQAADVPLGTLDTTDRYALATVVIDGELYEIVDIGMRMLTPRELFAAQGFGPDYVIDPIGPKGKKLTKTEQIRSVGNSVCPPVAEALVSACFAGVAA